VADVVLLCVLRVTMHALFRLHDQYLISNCFAIVLDLAYHVKGIDCYVSERVTKVMIQLGKRLKQQQRQQENNTGSSSSSSSSSDQIETTFDTLAIMFKLCGIALRPARRVSNVHLLYALVHASEKLTSVFSERKEEGASGGDDDDGGDGASGVMQALQAGAERHLKSELSQAPAPGNGENGTGNNARGPPGVSLLPQEVRILLYYCSSFLFLCVISLSLSYPSIAACLHSLTRHDV
jgi:hypothetical protein